jgi:hypothetical protein
MEQPFVSLELPAGAESGTRVQDSKTEFQEVTNEDTTGYQLREWIPSVWQVGSVAN